MRMATLYALSALLFSVTSAAAERATYLCEITNWIQISPEGNLKNIERPEASLFSYSTVL